MHNFPEVRGEKFSHNPIPINKLDQKRGQRAIHRKVGLRHVNPNYARETERTSESTPLKGRTATFLMIIWF